MKNYHKKKAPKDLEIRRGLNTLAEKMATELCCELEAKGYIPIPKEKYKERKKEEVLQAFELECKKKEQAYHLVVDLIKKELPLLVKEKKEEMEQEMEKVAMNFLAIEEGENRELLSKKESFQDLLQVSNRFTFWIYDLGSRFFQDKQYLESFSLFQFLTDLNPFIYEYWLGLGMSQRNRREEEQALYSFMVAAALSPSHPIPRYHIADIYAERGCRQEAIDSLAVLAGIVEKEDTMQMKSALREIQNKIQRMGVSI